MMNPISMDLPVDFKGSVKTTNNRGFTPEEVAARCADKIIQVSNTAPPAIRDQANAFKGDLIKVLSFYMREAVNSDRTTICNALNEAGHQELSQMIRRL